MENKLPDPKDIQDFPHDNPYARIVRSGRCLYVVERKYYWDSAEQRGKEQRATLGKIQDGVFYTTAEYQRRFKRDGTPKPTTLPVNRPYRRKGDAGKEGFPAAAASAPAAAPASSTASAPAPAAAVAADAPVTTETVRLVRHRKVTMTNLRLGATVLFNAVAEKIGLREDLAAAFGDGQTADSVLSVAYHWLSSGRNAARLYETWAGQYILPKAGTMSPKDMTVLFQAVGANQEGIAAFQKLRMGRLDENEVVSYDATRIATEALQVEDAEKGLMKDGCVHRGIGLTLAVGHRSRQPVMFRIFPGSVPDVSTVPDMLMRFKELENKAVVAGVLDRGYYSEQNIARLCEEEGTFLVAARDCRLIREAYGRAMKDLWDMHCWLPSGQCFGTTVKIKVKGPGGKEHDAWAHCFRSGSKDDKETVALSMQIEEFAERWKCFPDPEKEQDGRRRAELRRKQGEMANSVMLRFFRPPEKLPGACRLTKDMAKINDAVYFHGCFASVSTKFMTTEAALEAYRGRDCIEKCFKAGKTGLGMDAVRSHGDDAVRGRFLIAMVALCILCQIRTEMDRAWTGSKTVAQPPLRTKLSFPELVNALGTISVTCFSNGQRCVSEVTARQHDIAAACGVPDAYRKLPTYIKRKI